MEKEPEMFGCFAFPGAFVFFSCFALEVLLFMYLYNILSLLGTTASQLTNMLARGSTHQPV